MNNLFKKIAIYFVLISIIISSSSFGFADSPFLIHERKTIENISSGVVHEHIQRFTSNGWLNVNVLRVNIQDQYTEIGSLFSDEGISKKEKLTQMMKNSNAVAGINGDFFYWNKYFSPLGTVVNNNELISSPSFAKEPLSVFTIDNNENPFLSYWGWNIKVIPENSDPISVRVKNKATSNYTVIGLYDKNWSSETFGNLIYDDMTEVIVINDTVTDIRVGQEPIDMPENGYILVGRVKLVKRY
ncbi:hypothetical protein [Caldisalinibacter kiritimatiensis]|uniref:Exopolysaccharide biosynthesis protein n=1 Tax=Caldisalinibacter kiritimatiensis TaxID=1304284 RepID=R1AQ89_9FIRM|nr:hypothetical protein [Caldisalinibacter kiritimatiensis]EOC99292.1 Exopolysaccharide biosynthesis protein [Caldisalinibacter kiritimatiensis]